MIPVCKVTEMYKRAIFLLFLPFLGQTSSIVLKLSLAFCFFLCYNPQLSIEYGLIGNAHSPE